MLIGLTKVMAASQTHLLAGSQVVITITRLVQGRATRMGTRLVQGNAGKIERVRALFKAKE
jgi:hypothetical protein